MPLKGRPHPRPHTGYGHGHGTPVGEGCAASREGEHSDNAIGWDVYGQHFQINQGEQLARCWALATAVLQASHDTEAWFSKREAQLPIMFGS